MLSIFQRSFIYTGVLDSYFWRFSENMGWLGYLYFICPVSQFIKIFRHMVKSILVEPNTGNSVYEFKMKDLCKGLSQSTAFSIVLLNYVLVSGTDWLQGHGQSTYSLWASVSPFIM